MRAIDADAFKNYIRSGYEEMKHLFNENLKVATLVTESFCKDIDEQPTIQPEPHWIPVVERTPEEDGRYLVCGAKGGIYHANYRGGWWTQVGCGGKLVPSVVAWCELPEPYKGVTE